MQTHSFWIRQTATGDRPRLRTAIIGLLLALTSVVSVDPAASIAQAQTAPPVTNNEQVVVISKKRHDLELIQSFAKILELPHMIRRVDGFDPAIVAISALTTNRIRVQALEQGITTVVLTDDGDRSYSIEVFVKGDSRYLQSIINTKFPNASVETFLVRDSVVLRGWVTEPAHINQIVAIAETQYPAVLNQMNVGGVQQVKLRTKVMEVQRSKIRRFGFNFLLLTRDFAFSSTPGQLVQLGASALPFNGPPAVTVDAATISDPQITYAYTGNDLIFDSFLEALKQEGLLKILAEPELVTTNGRPATMLSGGEFPILVPQSLGTTTIEYREFGVRMEAVPNILGNGRLRLEIQPEVSERDFTNSVTVNGSIVPGLTTRRVNTEVEMRFGQTLMIAGLISSRNTADTNKVPFFGEIPFLGAAFSRKNYTETETELVILVTPELVAPLQPDQVLQGGPGGFTDTPTDRELFWNGMIEVPKYGQECEGCLPPSMSEPLPPGHLTVPGLIEQGPVPGPGAAPGVAPGLPPLPGSDASTNAGSTAGRRDARTTMGRRDTGTTMGRPDAGTATGRRDARTTMGRRDTGTATGRRAAGTAMGRRDAGTTTASGIGRLNPFAPRKKVQQVRFESTGPPRSNRVRSRGGRPGLIEPDEAANLNAFARPQRSTQLIAPKN